MAKEEKTRRAVLFYETTGTVSGLKHPFLSGAGPAEQTSFGTWH